MIVYCRTNSRLMKTSMKHFEWCRGKESVEFEKKCGLLKPMTNKSFGENLYFFKYLDFPGDYIDVAKEVS